MPAEPPAPERRPILTAICRDVDYAEALAWQEAAVRRLKRESDAPERLWLVEHRPVVTLGRSGDGRYIKLSPKALAERGIDYHETRRGGDVTYHGPGQWTIYPVLRLDRFCRDLHRYLRRLEELVIVFLAGRGIAAGRREGRTGVWVGNDKIAAAGIAVSGWIAYHGIAVNICPRLEAFGDLIVPCGIAPSEGGVTSLEKLGGRPDMAETAADLLAAFFEVFPFVRADTL